MSFKQSVPEIAGRLQVSPPKARQPRRFLPSLDDRLESRMLLHGSKTATAIVGSAGLLPTEAVGSSTDMPIPGPKDGSTHEITVGPDGNFWISQMYQDRMVRMTLDGKFTFFPMGEGSMPHGEEFDANGHLWVGLEGYGSLVEMDPNGTILSSHTIPYTNTYGYSDVVDNHGLHVASDGKVWYTGKASNLVGYYDPATNQFASFPLANPDPTAYPDGNFPIYIDEAPDGSMYFTELDTSRVGRIFPKSGEVINYILPGAYGEAGNARPIRVLVRDDGVAVVSEEAGSAYAYISKQGVVTEYPLSPSGSEAASLTYDRAGVLWVQYNTPDAIGQVQPDGTVKPFTIPTLDAVQHRITIGPDGSLWFTELAVDKIGRMVTGNESGPPITHVASQNFQAKNGGVAYQAAFKQGKAKYDAVSRQTLKGHGNIADRKLALSHFSWNLQGAVNKLASSHKALTFGVKLPKRVGPNLKSRFEFHDGKLTFTQTEKIGKATYTQSFTMKVGHAKGAKLDFASLSSATAHYLEALKVLSNGVGTPPTKG
ncbi:virginiamycin B lyase family protein [Tundrisphaera lichenicola]|uniref:Vgb family protein n=1 Tax=Tundrisphaera lichenicola TaxID=2029860 RepID=UPI003EBF8B3C